MKKKKRKTSFVDIFSHLFILFSFSLSPFIFSYTCTCVGGAQLTGFDTRTPRLNVDTPRHVSFRDAKASGGIENGNGRRPYPCLPRMRCRGVVGDISFRSSAPRKRANNSSMKRKKRLRSSTMKLSSCLPLPLSSRVKYWRKKL